MKIDSNVAIRAITDYIENQWYSDIGWEIEIIDNNNNYTAVLRRTQRGYDIEDYTFSCTFSFNDVQDASDEWVEELANEDEGTICLSAFVDVDDITIPEIHSIWLEDIYQFNKMVTNLYRFIRAVYATLPSKANERFYFFYTER